MDSPGFNINILASLHYNYKERGGLARIPVALHSTKGCIMFSAWYLKSEVKEMLMRWLKKKLKVFFQSNIKYDNCNICTFWRISIKQCFQACGCSMRTSLDSRSYTWKCKKLHHWEHTQMFSTEGSKVVLQIGVHLLYVSWPLLPYCCFQWKPLSMSVAHYLLSSS